MTKNIILTGGSRGLGLTICKTLLENEFNLTVLNKTISNEQKKLKTEFENLIIHEIDLRDHENFNAKNLKKIIGSEIPIHGLINNAAIAYDELFTNMNTENLKEMYNVNVFAPMIITKAVIRNMLLNNIKGSIVHISSISVHTGYKGLSLYASTKGALEAFSKNLAREWGARGIRSNCVVAGFMETDMSAKLNDEQKSRIYERTSLKSPTSMKDVANSVMFLLSDNSYSITGQNIFVDAGTI